jgi:hypothetical protein
MLFMGILAVATSISFPFSLLGVIVDNQVGAVAASSPADW